MYRRRDRRSARRCRPICHSGCECTPCPGPERRPSRCCEARQGADCRPEESRFRTLRSRFRRTARPCPVRQCWPQPRPRRRPGQRCSAACLRRCPSHNGPSVALAPARLGTDTESLPDLDLPSALALGWGKRLALPKSPGGLPLPRRSRPTWHVRGGSRAPTGTRPRLLVLLPPRRPRPP